jgi:hypothetical protein
MGGAGEARIAGEGGYGREECSVEGERRAFLYFLSFLSFLLTPSSALSPSSRPLSRNSQGNTRWEAVKTITSNPEAAKKLGNTKKEKAKFEHEEVCPAPDSLSLSLSVLS